MAGLDHRSADIGVREQFALTGEKTGRALASIKKRYNAGGCVIISTCNRTELYASVPDGFGFSPALALCEALGEDYAAFSNCFSERAGERAIERLCRVASGLDSQITGDDQIITQTREAVELARTAQCTDSYTETVFRLAIQAAKSIKTNVILKTVGSASIPDKTVKVINRIYPLTGRDAVVIGNGQTGRLVAELLIREGVNVTVTVREYKKGAVYIPERAAAVMYGERYGAVERADIVVSATKSPHFTLRSDVLRTLPKRPDVIVDLAVPRDVEPSACEIPGIRLLTIDDISDDGRALPPESNALIDAIIEAHIEKYNRWKNGGWKMEDGG